MCVIVDVNNCHKVFGESGAQTPAGRYLFDWLESETGRLIFGGTKFKTEIAKVGRYTKWLKTAHSKGRAYNPGDQAVDREERTLLADDACQSDDQHLVALARIAGARLIFTEDPALQADFADPDLIAHPRGKVYSTRIDYEVSAAHRQLLDARNRNDMCAANCAFRN